MPELPEAERARQAIERALDREIVAVDDSDTYVCRPHAPGEIAAALVGRGNAPVKARLLDQNAVAGGGNLLADEILWQAGISPRRRTGTLTDDELDELRRATRRAIRNAIRRGGAHTGEFNPERHEGGRCPRCGTELSRARIGGRTTYRWPQHQPHSSGASS